MQKKYKGLILYLKIHKENDLYVKFLSDTNELVSGIVYGGLSKNKRNIYQLGSFLYFNISIKTNRPPSISGELIEPYLSPILQNKYKLNCLLSIISLVNLSIIEGQKIKYIYNTVEIFLKKMIISDRWLVSYCRFLFSLLKIIGYEIDYSDKLKKNYFDLIDLEFLDNSSENSIVFPFDLLESHDNSQLNYNNVNNVFKIFETVFTKNHLSNLNLYLPNQYLLFKKLIIDYLKIK